MEGNEQLYVDTWILRGPSAPIEFGHRGLLWQLGKDCKGSSNARILRLAGGEKETEKNYSNMCK